MKSKQYQRNNEEEDSKMQVDDEPNHPIEQLIEHGDWGLGIGDWGLGPIPNPQSPILN